MPACASPLLEEPLALDDFLARLNARIADRIGREKQIGHSYLLRDGKPIEDAAEFARMFRFEILPLLQEYCYENFNDLAYFVGEQLVDIEDERVRADVLYEPEALIEALGNHLAAEPAEE